MKKIITIMLILAMSLSCIAESCVYKYKDEDWYDTLFDAAWWYAEVNENLITVNNEKIDIPLSDSSAFFNALADVLSERYEQQYLKPADRDAMLGEMLVHWYLYNFQLFTSRTKVTDLEIR